MLHYPLKEGQNLTKNFLLLPYHPSNQRSSPTPASFPPPLISRALIPTIEGHRIHPSQTPNKRRILVGATSYPPFLFSSCHNCSDLCGPCSYSLTSTKKATPHDSERVEEAFGSCAKLIQL